MTDRECEWLIEPLDPASNESIARELPEEDLLYGARCHDGRIRNLWRCSFDQLKYFWQGKKQDLNFRVYNRKGCGRNKGPIRRLPLKVAERIFSVTKNLDIDYAERH